MVLMIFIFFFFLFYGFSLRKLANGQGHLCTNNTVLTLHH